MILGSTRYIHPPIYGPPPPAVPAPRGATCLRAWSWCSLVVVEEDGVQAVTGGDVMGSVWQAYCEKLLARFGSIFREIA